MPVKKGKPPVKKAETKSKAVRYLLSADRKLQKLSLKRLSARATKPAKPARPAGRSKPAPAARSSMHVPRALQLPAVLLAFIGVVTAATLLAARAGSNAPEIAAAGVIADVSPQAAEVRVVSAARERVGPTPAPSAVTESRTAAPGTAVSAPSPKAVPAAATAAPAVVQPAANDTPRPPVPSPSAEPEAGAKTAAERPSPAGPAPVTITGCVEAARGTFWLKDTSGDEAPKSRSWKSGFLRRSPARIELIAPASALRPSDHVGQRVAATGVLTDRELRVRSLRRVAASCD